MNVNNFAFYKRLVGSSYEARIQLLRSTPRQELPSRSKTVHASFPEQNYAIEYRFCGWDV